MTTKIFTIGILGGTKHDASSWRDCPYLLSINVLQAETNPLQKHSEITSLTNNSHPRADKTKRKKLDEITCLSLQNRSAMENESRFPGRLHQYSAARLIQLPSKNTKLLAEGQCGFLWFCISLSFFSQQKKIHEYSIIPACKMQLLKWFCT